MTLVASVFNLILYKMEKGELSLESKEALRNILQEYEIHTKMIEDQLEMCKKDHDDLRVEITGLIEENKDLYQRLKTNSENVLFKGEQSTACDNHSDIIENLNHQLGLAIKEKESVEELWKSSLKEVDALTEKLQHYQSGKQITLVQSRLNDVQRDYTEAIQILESRLSTLKTKNDQFIAKIELLENQLLQVTSQVALITDKNLSLKNSLMEKTTQEQDLKSQYLNLESKYIELDRSYQTDKVKFAHTYEYEKVESQLKEKLEAALRERDEVQTALERCHERMADLLRKSASDRSQVAEAVALVEGAMRDREEALSRELQSTEEIKKLKFELDMLVEEAGLRVAEEVAAAKKHFDSQLAVLSDRLQIAEQDRARKSTEVQQLQKECERLKTIADQGPKLSLSDKRDGKIETVYKELHLAESECLQLRLETEALHASLDKLQNRCRKSSLEKVNLKHELQSVGQQSQLYQQELAVASERADLLSTQLHQTCLELAQLQQDTLSQRASVKNAQTKVTVANTIELYKRLDDSYGQMNDKWRNEMNALTEKFEAELIKLKAKNKRLSRKGETSQHYDSQNIDRNNVTA